MRKDKLIWGAIILSFAGIIAKIIGFAFKVPLVRIIGLDGLGIYNYPYFLYITIVAFTISGVPIALSKLISESIANEEYEKTQSIFKVALRLMWIVGVTTSGMLLMFSKLIVKQFWPAEALFPLLALSLAPVFLSVLAVYRGYFQGLQLMKPIAISQIIEAFGRLGIGLSLAIYFISSSTAYAAGGAALGTTAGAFLSVVVLNLYYKKHKMTNHLLNKNRIIPKNEFIKVVKTIISLALPVSVGAVAGSLMPLIDSLIINSRLLSAGYSTNEALILYGKLGVGNTLISFPLTVSTAIGVSLVPALSESIASGDDKLIENRIKLGISMGIILSLPSAIGLFLLANPILELVFPAVNGGDAVLMILSVGLFFMIINQVFTSILQGMGKVMIPVKHLYFGSVFKIVSTYILCSFYSINVHGAALSTVFSYILISILNYFSFRKHSKYNEKIENVFYKTGIAVFAMGVCVIRTYSYLIDTSRSSILTLTITIIIGVLVYSMGLLFTNVISVNEVKKYIINNT